MVDDWLAGRLAGMMAVTGRMADCQDGRLAGAVTGRLSGWPEDRLLRARAIRMTDDTLPIVVALRSSVIRASNCICRRLFAHGGRRPVAISLRRVRYGATRSRVLSHICRDDHLDPARLG